MRLHVDKNKRREKERTIYGLNENKDKYDDNNRIKIKLKKKCIKIAREKKYWSKKQEKEERTTFQTVMILDKNKEVLRKLEK